MLPRVSHFVSPALCLGKVHTLLVQNQDIATVQVDGVGGTKAGHWDNGSADEEMGENVRGRRLTSTADHNDLGCCHFGEMMCKEGKGDRIERKGKKRVGKGGRENEDGS